MDCCSELTKVLFLFFNCIIAVQNVILIMEISAVDFIGKLVLQVLGVVEVMSTVKTIACLLLIISLVGSCGAITNKSSLLLLYSVVIPVSEFFSRYWIDVISTEDVVVALRGMFELKGEGDTNLFDDVQSQFLCCGVNGPSDYLKGFENPSSCQGTSGCGEIIHKWYLYFIQFIVGKGYAMVTIEIISVFLAMQLYTEIVARRKRKSS